MTLSRTDEPFTAPSAHRFAVASFTDGAVLVDFASGALYRLNAAAALVAQALARGGSAARAAEHLVAAYSVSEAIARRDVASVLAQLHSAAPTGSTNPIRFTREPDGYCLLWQGHPVCCIDPTGRTLAELPGLPAGRVDPATRLLWAVPHLLLLQGHLVLHASAVRVGDEVVAFFGASGAGKTTLARSFAERGRPIISEDLLVVSPGQDRPMVATAAERLIRRWVEDHGGLLISQGRVPTDGLAGAVQGPWLPLRELLLIGRQGPTTHRLRREPVGPADALTLLLENSFAELGQPEIWRALWEAHCLIAKTTPVFRLWVPDGLEQLARAVADYTWTLN